METAAHALPARYWYIAYDGLDYVLAPAPLVARAASNVAIADRGSVHVVSTLRRRTVSSP